MAEEGKKPEEGKKKEKPATPPSEGAKKKNQYNDPFTGERCTKTHLDLLREQGKIDEEGNPIDPKSPEPRRDSFPMLFIGMSSILILIFFMGLADVRDRIAAAKFCDKQDTQLALVTQEQLTELVHPMVEEALKGERTSLQRLRAEYESALAELKKERASLPEQSVRPTESADQYAERIQLLEEQMASIPAEQSGAPEQNTKITALEEKLADQESELSFLRQRVQEHGAGKMEPYINDLEQENAKLREQIRLLKEKGALAQGGAPVDLTPLEDKIDGVARQLAHHEQSSQGRHDELDERVSRLERIHEKDTGAVTTVTTPPPPKDPPKVKEPVETPPAEPVIEEEEITPDEEVASIPKDTGRPQRDGTYLVNGSEFTRYWWGENASFPLQGIKMAENEPAKPFCMMSLAGGVQTKLTGLWIGDQKVDDPKKVRPWPLGKLITLHIPASDETKTRYYDSVEYREIVIVVDGKLESRLIQADGDNMLLRFTFLPIKRASGYECKIVFQHEEKQTT